MGTELATVEEILKDAQDKLVKIVPQALGVVEELLYAPDDKVRLAAAKDILDRAGLAARVKVEGEFTVTMDDEIERLFERLTRPAPVIDVEELLDDDDNDEDLDESQPANRGTRILSPIAPTG